MLTHQTIRRLLPLLFSCLLALSPLLAPAAHAQQTRQQAGIQLGLRRMQELGIKRRKNLVHTLLFMATPGTSATLAADITRLHGKVDYHDAGVGYVRARIRGRWLPRVLSLPTIAAVSRDRLFTTAAPPAQTASPAAVAPPDDSTPTQNPYMPTQDIGAPQFMAANPSFDGRGVKIGIVDTGVDLLTPELQTATTLDGTSTRKIVDWVSATDPYADDDPTWLRLTTTVTATAALVSYNGITYTVPLSDGLPRLGSYRIGTLNERDPRLGGELGTDVNRDGNPSGSSGLFGVLWDRATGEVWVDSNQNQSFADQQAMTDYKRRYDVGIFGTDNISTTDRLERVGYVVQTRWPDAVNIGIFSAGHGTHVAGIAAGKNFFGGSFDGAAPEAQIVSVRACLWVKGCSTHAMMEGMIYLARDARVDVINMSLSDGYVPLNTPLGGGPDPLTLLYSRLTTKYKVLLFLAAGNTGPGINTVNYPSYADGAISVGAYVHKDAWLAHYGATATRADGLFTFSSRGPREDGGMKPTLVAPGSAISSLPAHLPSQPLPGTYALPPGYGMFNGTSMAAPQAAGGTALLISAAKQTGVRWSPDQLRQALTSSARYLPAYGAYEQGAGLLQVGGAWELLKTGLRPVSISTQAPVKTILSQMLPSPHQGTGLYEREGWAAGMSAQRVITMTRLSGSYTPIAYSLSWTGNDGTFSAPASVLLPRNTPVAVPIGISVATSGAHSAILLVDDPATVGVDHQVLHTVVAAEQFDEANQFRITHVGQADRPDRTPYFLALPPGVPALRVDLATSTSRLRFVRFQPEGLPYDVPNTIGFQTGGSQSRSVAKPMSGAWELSVENSRTSPDSVGTYTMTATMQGAAITPGLWKISQATPGVTQTGTLTFTNPLGEFSGAAAGSALDSVRSMPVTVTSQLTTSITVPANTSALTITIGGASDPLADIDLVVYHGVISTTTQVAWSRGYAAEETIRIDKPSGTYIVLIDGYSLPSGPTKVNYVDIIANPGYGTLAISDSTASHPHGEIWTRQASVVARAAPLPGRYLRGFVEVRSAGLTLARSEVRVKSVLE